MIGKETSESRTKDRRKKAADVDCLNAGLTVGPPSAVLLDDR